MFGLTKYSASPALIPQPHLHVITPGIQQANLYRLEAFGGDRITRSLLGQTTASGFFENLSRIFNFHLNLTWIKGTLNNRKTFLIRSVLLSELETILIKVAQEIKIHASRSITILFKSRVACEIMWKSIAEPNRPQITTKHGACALHAVYLRQKTHTQKKWLFAFPL